MLPMCPCGWNLELGVPFGFCFERACSWIFGSVSHFIFGPFVYREMLSDETLYELSVVSQFNVKIIV